MILIGIMFGYTTKLATEMREVSVELIRKLTSKVIIQKHDVFREIIN